ncbi:MAG: hypothetical protein JWM38_1377 [Sphingomonas bacterium]|nr:hypothetical protein [Sphingomonas bacterium]
MIVRAQRLGRPALLAIAIGTGAASASAETRITPYLEVQQVLDADLGGNGGDVLTYTALAAGVNASVSGDRVQATATYRYERRIPWNDNLEDANIHSGLARASVQVVPQLLTIEGGAIATRVRSDIRGAAPVFLTGDNANVTQVYGGYIGPSLATRVGDLQVGANYQLGYVRADSSNNILLAPGQPRLDTFDDATSHNLNASVAMPVGNLPFGWTVSGGYSREDTGQLDQRYDGKYARLDLVLPVAATLALTAGVGYEDIEASQRAPLRDPFGVPLIGSDGRYRTDPSSPRLLSYDSDGLIYDAGVIWRPNRRTTLTARAGHRYGGTTVTGSLDWRMSQNSGLQVVVYDGIESVGRLLTRNLNALPTGFELPRNPLLDPGGGCVFGTTPGTGGCLNDVFQSLNTANFRNRGVSALYTLGRGPWTFGLGGGYTQRKYFAPIQPAFFSLDGIKDESWTVQANAARPLSASSGVNAALFADWYKSGIDGGIDVSSTGATGSYYHMFGQRLSAQASLGVYTFDQDGFESDLRGQLLLGMRYQF